MARTGFRDHPKFKRLVKLLGQHPAKVYGHVEFLWQVAYQHGPVVGDAADVEEAADWDGEAGALARAMATCGGSREGLLEEHEGLYRIHDFEDHAPGYIVQKHRAKAVEPRKCQWCGGDYRPRRVDQCFCSPRCKTANFRANGPKCKASETPSDTVPDTLENERVSRVTESNKECLKSVAEKHSPSESKAFQEYQENQIADTLRHPSTPLDTPNLYMPNLTYKEGETAPSGETLREEVEGMEIGGVNRPKRAGRPDAVIEKPKSYQAEIAVAIAAFDAWSKRPPPIGRGYGMESTKGEHRDVIALVDELDAEGEILMNGNLLVKRHKLIVRAIQMLREKGTPFKAIRFACGCVRTTLKDWADAGVSDNPRKVLEQAQSGEAAQKVQKAAERLRRASA